MAYVTNIQEDEKDYCCEQFGQKINPPLFPFLPRKPIEEYSVKSSDRQNYTQLTVLKHQNSKTSLYKLPKSYGIIALFTRTAENVSKA